MVAVKRVADPNARVPIAADGLGFDLAGVRMTLNPYDEIAVDEAVRLRERGVATEVVAVTVGDSACEDVLRSAMAIGASRAIHIVTNHEVQPLAAAHALAFVAAEEQPNLVLMGKQSVDGESNQTGQMLAGLLDWPQATFASRIAIDNGTATVDREVDAGLETLSVDLPAVVTADLRLNVPRYPTLPNLLRARKLPIETRDAVSVGLDLAPRLRITQITAPERKRAGVRIESAEQLFAHLAERGVLE